jgi:hypothetical protein
MAAGAGPSLSPASPQNLTPQGCVDHLFCQAAWSLTLPQVGPGLSQCLPPKPQCLPGLQGGTCGPKRDSMPEEKEGNRNRGVGKAGTLGL